MSRGARRSWRRHALWILAVLACGIPAEGDAAKLRRPFSNAIGVNYGFDHNYGNAGCVDYGCGSRCYDGHGGTDFPLPMGTTVRAAAAGTVTYTNDGCPSWGSLGNSCGGGFGNYVRIDHNDGTVTYYGHMTLGSVAVSTGQQVTCGQVVGASGSSGSSTGPHLHFELRVWGTRTDPFGGSCSQATSYWVNQGSYSAAMPSTECESTCACTPGQTQSGSCGNCGTRSRTCQSSCQWGSWSACTGQGVCSPGATQTQSCCDCGSRTRTCSGSCQWNGWSDCQGPDPNGGNTMCDEGGCGPCADGRMRCVDGCLACVSIYSPAPETCDDVDNDCNCEVDDGFPETLGTPPPTYAARLVDFTHPAVMSAGELGHGWALFENVGTDTWPAGGVWLASRPDTPGTASDFHDPPSWPAWDVLAVADRGVPPGETAMMELTLRAPDRPGVVAETFQLLAPDGATIQCPAPTLEVEVLVVARATEPAPAEEVPLDAHATSAAEAGDAWSTGCGCGTRPTSAGPPLAPLILLPLLLLGIRRRRG